MAGTSVEGGREDAAIAAVERDDALPESGEEIRAMGGDRDDGVGRAVEDKGVATASVKGEEDGGAITEELQGLVGSGLAHDGVACVPVAAGTVEVTAADKEKGVDARVGRSRERGDE